MQFSESQVISFDIIWWKLQRYMHCRFWEILVFLRGLFYFAAPCTVCVDGVGGQRSLTSDVDWKRSCSSSANKRSCTRSRDADTLHSISASRRKNEKPPLKLNNRNCTSCLSLCLLMSVSLHCFARGLADQLSCLYFAERHQLVRKLFRSRMWENTEMICCGSAMQDCIMVKMQDTFYSTFRSSCIVRQFCCYLLELVWCLVLNLLNIL